LPQWIDFMGNQSYSPLLNSPLCSKMTAATGSSAGCADLLTLLWLPLSRCAHLEAANEELTAARNEWKAEAEQYKMQLNKLAVVSQS
jgi:hypothetical protein